MRIYLADGGSLFKMVYGVVEDGASLLSRANILQSFAYANDDTE